MKKLIIFITIITIALVGCKKSYFDINTNPNTASSASPDLVLSNALTVTAARQITPNNVNYVSAWMNYWTPSGSYAVSNTDAGSYAQTTGFADGFWTNYYRNLEDYQYIQTASTASNSYFYIAAAKTMKAFVFQLLVDCFNDVPYSSALQGTNSITPTYDKGQAIYESLSTDLGAAVTLFQRADAVGSSTQDVLFGGNNAKWAQFANTLRLRILMHQTQMSGRSAYIQGEISKILANGAGFLTVDAKVNPGYVASTGKQNPFYSLCINPAGTYIGDFWRANKYSITFCTTNNDPRSSRWYAPTSTGALVGNVLGSQNNAVGSASSVFGPGLLVSSAQSAVIMTAAESYFLQAEAGLKGFIANSPQTLFNSGVQSSFTYLGAGSADAYTSQVGNKNTNYAACSNDADRLACIIRQKWLAFNTTTPLEAWSDYRRLGLPADLPISISTLTDITPAAIPLRFLYPATEYTSNVANVNAEGTINHHTSKIFWMP